jgi:L-lactate utilization protein LutC
MLRRWPNNQAVPAGPPAAVRSAPPIAELDLASRAKHHAAMTASECDADSPQSLEGAILALCNRAGSGRTICPTDAAQAYAAARGESPVAWRVHLSQVRRAAVRLAEAGQIVIYRKGKPADPHDFRGVYRLGTPRCD